MVHVHIVRSGDTLTKIARQYNVSIERLVRENNITNPDLIVIGQHINIPAQDAMLRLVNQIRQQHGKHALTLNQKLMNAAYLHSKYMADHNVMTHHQSNRTLYGVGERVKYYQYHFAGVAENVAYNYSDDIPSVVDQWVKSPRHFQNMLGDFAEMGHARCAKGDRIYWTQVFGKSFT